MPCPLVERLLMIKIKILKNSINEMKKSTLPILQFIKANKILLLTKGRVYSAKKYQIKLLSKMIQKVKKSKRYKIRKFNNHQTKRVYRML
jgi:hypothetical protein